MPPKTPKLTVSSLKQQSDHMNKEIVNLRSEFQRLQAGLSQHEAAHGVHVNRGPDPETEKTLEFMGEEYDDLKKFCSTMQEKLSVLMKRLDSVDERVRELSAALDVFTQYSYGFNIKLLDVPEIDPSAKESSLDTSNLCVKIFNAMGAHVSLSDIDIAHRVPARNSLADKPKPIICKFVRRLAREEVMSLRRRIKDVDPSVVSLDAEADFSNAHIVDHLPPKTQELYAAAKKFKTRHQYAFCWSKNANIFLRRSEDSRVIKVRDLSFLHRLTQDELESNNS